MAIHQPMKIPARREVTICLVHRARPMATRGGRIDHHPKSGGMAG